jgi:hypothetical protein
MYRVETMPFGEHKGKPLDEVPTSYIQWLLKSSTDLSPRLRKSLFAVTTGDWEDMPSDPEGGAYEEPEPEIGKKAGTIPVSRSSRSSSDGFGVPGQYSYRRAGLRADDPEVAELKRALRDAEQRVVDLCRAIDRGAGERERQKALIEEMRRELIELRSKSGRPTPLYTGSLAGVDTKILNDILKAGWAVCIKRAHPDHGGTSTEFQAVMAAWHEIKKQVPGLSD